jgi:hypothetical protein
MTSRKVYFLLTILFISVSCNSDEDVSPVNKCLPLNLSTSSALRDSLVFEYDAARKPLRILSYKDLTLTNVTVFEYDNTGRLAGEKYYGPDTSAPPLQTFEFHYHENGKIQYRSVKNLNETELRRTVNFAHDNHGRLVKMTYLENGQEIRYEYNNDGNVVRTYYRFTPAHDEVLGRENHSFDNAAPFYANSTELTTWAIYVWLLPPSKNNILSSTIYQEDPGTSLLLEQKTLSHEAKYDDLGMIKDFNNLTDTFYYREFYYKNVNYECP